MSKCIICRTNEYRHKAKGRCTNCYARAYRRKNKQTIQDRNKLWMREYRAGRRAKGLTANGKLSVRKVMVITYKESRKRRTCLGCSILLSSPCAGKVKGRRCEGCQDSCSQFIHS